MDELIMAVLDSIDNELQRCYWNKNQKKMNSPFLNTGESYSNNTFTVRAYDWSDKDEYPPNFESDKLKCWWYKHSHRGLEWELDISIVTIEDLADFLNECLESIREDFL